MIDICQPINKLFRYHPQIACEIVQKSFHTCFNVIDNLRNFARTFKEAIFKFLKIISFSLKFLPRNESFRKNTP